MYGSPQCFNWYLQNQGAGVKAHWIIFYKQRWLMFRESWAEEWVKEGGENSGRSKLLSLYMPEKYSEIANLMFLMIRLFKDDFVCDWRQYKITHTNKNLDLLREAS